MRWSRPARLIALTGFGLVLTTGCQTMNHPPERVWPDSTPGSYAGRTETSRGGEWWFPSEIGPREVPPQGGNKGTLFYLGRGEEPAPPPPVIRAGEVQRTVYKAVYRDKDVRVERLIFPAIVFEHESVKLDAEAKLQVRQAAAAIERAQGYRVVIEGHLDAQENADAGYDAKRAQNVQSALRSRGVARDRLTIQAFGASQPLSRADTAVAHALNRRVAFQMIPTNLDLDPQPPPDDPEPDVPDDIKVVTVEKTVTITRPHLVFVDRLVFPNILFDYDKSSLRPEGVVRTDRAAAAIAALDDVSQVTVEGHCDWIGSDVYNDALSGRRAKAVRGRLIDQGLAPDLISAAGRGKRQPIADNETAEGRQLNRRVEFRIEYDR